MPRKGTAAAARAKAARAKTKEDGPKAESPVIQALSQGFAAKQAKIAAPARTGDTVTVGCKTPNGLILQLQEAVKVSLPVLGGGFKEVVENRPDPSGKTYTLHGNRVPHGEQPKCLVVGGFAMTPGIPADFMDRWMEQNKRLDIVTAGLIIVQRTTDSARAEAREKKDLRSGLESIRPGDDPRIPKRKDAKSGKLVDAIETGDEQPAAA